MSEILYNTAIPTIEEYNEQLKYKIDSLKDTLGLYYHEYCAAIQDLESSPTFKFLTTLVDNIEVIPSDYKYFRHRCRFQIKHFVSDVTLHRLKYVLWKNGNPCVEIEEFPIGSYQINYLMPVVLKYCELN